MRFVWLFWICTAFVPSLAQAQTPCNNPITLNGHTVLNTNCGNATGAIILNVKGGDNGLKFDWIPAQANKSSIFDVKADAYRVRITRANDPNCRFDTTIIVNNTDGPAVSVIDVRPAACLSGNGKVTLAPTNLAYLWSNTETGSVNDSLTAGCYTVTATAAAGCYAVFQVCVPSANALRVASDLLKPAKCGKANGKIGLTITGGTGNYNYCLGGSSPTLSNLSAGSYSCTIVDRVTGCQAATQFTVPSVTPQATVKVSTYNVRCPGNNDGFVVFSVEPGANFEAPYTFNLTNVQTGAKSSPGSLSPGLYDLAIQDADGCPVAPVSFLITAPPPFLAQTTLRNATCDVPGQLLLNLSGGNGKYIVDWADLPGSNNGKDRLNIAPGIYNATIYDSLFCQYPLSNALVGNTCSRPDTLYRFVKTNSKDTTCFKLPTGITQGAFSLIGKSVSGKSNFGTWTLSPQGCLVYEAKALPGYAVDTVCVQLVTANPNLNKTWCTILSLSNQPTPIDTVYFTVQVNTSATACGTVPTNFTNRVVTLRNGKGLNGSSGSFGTYTVNNPSACLTFTSIGQPGYFVDNIYVNIYDLALRQGKTICYIPSVLPLANCTPVGPLPDTVQTNISNCTDVAELCIPVPFTDISQYAIFNNAAPYAGGFAVCDVEPKTAYVLGLPQNGPYTMENWPVNGQSYSGVFANPTGLVALMNQLDPSGNWSLTIDNKVVGGKTGTTYGNIRVITPQGTAVTLSTAKQDVAKGTKLQFPPGLHRLTFRQFSTGCIDTLYVRVRCTTCPTVYTQIPNAQGLFRWKTNNCAQDTVFCTTISKTNLNQYTYKDNGLPFTKFRDCGNFVGLAIDTGFHDLKISDPQGVCQYNLKVRYDCRTALSDQVNAITLREGEVLTTCPDTTLLGAPLTVFDNTCTQSPNGVVGLSLDTKKRCVVLTALKIGTDTLCVKACNADNECVRYQFHINVLSKEDTFYAAPDFYYTPRNKPIDGTVLENDGYFGQLTVALLSQPRYGTIALDPDDGTFTYTPNNNVCKIDSFRYQIVNTLGRIASAAVQVETFCEKVIPFTGISPNGDNQNDVWHIAGIETYPNNLVRVFNRWGHQVFEAQPYRNDQPWDGRWQDKDLPDGTYYFVIDLGDRSDMMTGYIELRR